MHAEWQQPVRGVAVQEGYGTGLGVACPDVGTGLRMLNEDADGLPAFTLPGAQYPNLVALCFAHRVRIPVTASQNCVPSWALDT